MRETTKIGKLELSDEHGRACLLDNGTHDRVPCGNGRASLPIFQKLDFFLFCDLLSICMCSKHLTLF